MPSLNPWKTLTSQMKYNNPWISVREDRVVRPDGNDGIYGVVHFKNKAIGILPIDQEGNTYLVGQYRYTLDAYSWEIPEGGCPEGEEPLEAAKRELLEETGLIAGSWQMLGRAHLSNSVSDEEAIYYLARELRYSRAQPEGTEQLTLRRLPLKEVATMIHQGEITDALTIMAVMQYLHRAPVPA